MTNIKNLEVDYLADPNLFKIVGMLGVTLGLIRVILPSLVYRGTKGEKYSFLTHYIPAVIDMAEGFFIKKLFVPAGVTQ